MSTIMDPSTYMHMCHSAGSGSGTTYFKYQINRINVEFNDDKKKAQNKLQSIYKENDKKTEKKQKRMRIFLTWKHATIERGSRWV